MSSPVSAANALLSTAIVKAARKQDVSALHSTATAKAVRKQANVVSSPASAGDRPAFDRNREGRPQTGERPAFSGERRERPAFDRNRDSRPQTGSERPAFDRNREGRPANRRTA